MSTPKDSPHPKSNQFTNTRLLAPLEWSTSHPIFEVPEWEEIEFTDVSPLQASRHFLITGETGSGKTKSAVMPLLRAAFIYPTPKAYKEYLNGAKKKGKERNRQYLPDQIDDLRPSILVIDPKSELVDYLYALKDHYIDRPNPQDPDYDSQNPIRRDIIHFGSKKEHKTLWLFEGVDLEATASAVETRADEICRMIFSTSDYLDREIRNSKDPYFGEAAKTLLESLVKIDYWVKQQEGLSGLIGFWQEVAKRIPQIKEERETARIISKQWELLNEQINQVHRTCVELNLLLEEPDEELETIPGLIFQLQTAANNTTRGYRFDDLIKVYHSLRQDFKEKQETLPADSKLKEKWISLFTHFAQLELAGEVIIKSGQKRTVDHQPESGLDYRPENYLLHHYSFINLISRDHLGVEGNPVVEAYLSVCQSHDVRHDLYIAFNNYLGMAPGTLTSVFSVANNVLAKMTDEKLVSLICFNPYQPPEQSVFLSVDEVFDRGYCVIYSPSDESDPQTLAGQILKSKFFEFTFKRHNRIRPFVYICDEFQRFVTSDKESGEQSFLDRCRAYRAVCVLATQSISSLAYALSAKSSIGNSDTHSALEIMTNNTGNKLYFRNSDSNTQDLLSKILPSPYLSGRPPLISARPVSTLQVGECYYLTSNGKQGRGQIKIVEGSFYEQFKDQIAIRGIDQYNTFQQQTDKHLRRRNYLGNFIPERSYQQIRYKSWPSDQKILDIHYELSLSFHDFMSGVEFVYLGLHVEGPENHAFVTRFIETHPQLPVWESQPNKTILVLTGGRIDLTSDGLDVFKSFVDQFHDLTQNYTKAINQILAKLEEEKGSPTDG